MEKPQQRYADYSSISKNESFLLGIIKNAELTVFGVKELHVLTDWSDNRINNTLTSLEKKELLVRIKRNHYALADIISEHSFELATETIKPSYISFWSALSYYGFTEQQVTQIQLVSTKQFKDHKIASYIISITTFKPELFYGYTQVEDFVIAEMEKALVDSLYLPEKCGGLNEFVKCLVNSWKTINKSKLIKYILKFDNKSLISRVGYLIDTLGLENNNLTDQLFPYRSKSYIKLWTRGEKILSYNNKWRIINNHEIELEEMI